MLGNYLHTNESSITSSRILLQRGLRINPKAPQLWIEYFKLELLWVEKLRERRKILFKEDSNKTKLTENDPDVEMEPTEISEEEKSKVDVEVLEVENGIDLFQADRLLLASKQEGTR